jgi:hypothetical protein
MDFELEHPETIEEAVVLAHAYEQCMAMIEELLVRASPPGRPPHPHTLSKPLLLLAPAPRNLRAVCLSRWQVSSISPR